MLLRQNEARAVWEVSMLTVSEDQRSNSPHPLVQSEAFSLVVLKNRSFMYMYHQLWQGSTSSLVSILLAVSVEKPWAVVYGLLRKHAPFHPVHSPFGVFPLLPFLPPVLVFLSSSSLSLPPLATACTPSLPNPALEEILRTYFPSKVDLFKRESPCFGFLVFLPRQTFLHVEFFSWISRPTWVFRALAVPYFLRLLWNFHSPALFLDLNHLDILLLISSWFL